MKHSLKISFKTIITIVFLIAFNFNLYSQDSFRIYYKVESKSNIKQDSANIDIFVLDIDTKNQSSKFYNFTYLKTDSIYNSLKKESELKGLVSFNTKNITYPNFNIGVIKSYSNYNIIQILDGDIYEYPDGKDIKWNLTSEVSKIDNYNCQKAEGVIGGREWAVYYTKDIPLTYGPYKFGGLPGLILFANDKTNSYNFKMIAIEKTNAEQSFEPNIFNRAIKTTKEKFHKALNNYKIDPVKKLKQGIISYPDGSYIKLSNPLSDEYIKKRENIVLKYLNENDNYIEKK